MSERMTEQYQIKSSKICQKEYSKIYEKNIKKNVRNYGKKNMRRYIRYRLSSFLICLNTLQIETKAPF